MDRPKPLLIRAFLGMAVTVAVLLAVPLVVAGALLLYLRAVIVLLGMLGGAAWRHWLLPPAIALKNFAASLRLARASASQKLAAK